MADAPKTTARGKRKKAANLEDKIFRLLAMILFGILLYPVYLVFLVLIAFQFVIYFVEDAPNPGLDGLLKNVRTYIGEIFAYLGFATETMPFPFSDFPKD